MKNSLKSSVLIFSFLILVFPVFSQLPPYKQAGLSVQQRVDDLLRRMTLEEKLELIHGAAIREADGGSTPVAGATPTTIIRAVNFLSQTAYNKRLCIPQLVMTDGPLGPNGKHGSHNYSATINFAASFDDSLVYLIAQHIGGAVRDLGYNMLLGPCINIARTPYGGRTFEGFGEDPYLVSCMAVAYVRGVESQNVLTCTKHYLLNNQEWNRMSCDAWVDERALHEIYLPAFKAVVQEAGGKTIMTAYNAAFGKYCAENDYLLNDILRGELGFDGVVVSDWGGVHSTLPTLQAGLDIEMPTGRFLGRDSVMPLLEKGVITEKLIDKKVRRILRVMFEAGLFDETAASYGGQAYSEERRKLALEMAEKSIVLLKNEKGFLPLDKEKYQKVAVIGPDADPSPVAGGGSGGNDGYFPVSLLQGIQDYYGACADVQYERGIAVARSELPVVPDSLLLLPASMGDEHGVWAEYFNNRDVAGTPALARKEKDVNFDWGYGGFRNPDEPGSPDPEIIRTDRWSARWTGRLIGPGDGWYDIGCKSDNGVRIYLDGKLIVDAWTDQAPGRYKITQYKFEKGKIYDLKIEFYENWGSCRCIMGMDRFVAGESSQRAVALARASDVVIMAMGLNKDMEGEAKDRDRLTLPKAQEDLIRAVTAANPKTVVVLYGATPVVMEGWLDQVPAVVDALYPGEEGGHALARILWGEVNPSGKLPLTFPRRWEESPVHATYPGPRDSVNYTEGIFMGYRGFDHNGVIPLFPFGYGLSYTTFAFEDLSLDRTTMTDKDTLRITFTVTNTGDRDGDEVAQLYIHDVKAKVPREVKALKGYKRVSLKKGQSRRVTLAVPPSALAYWNPETRQWTVEPGKFEVWIGNSAENILLKGSFKVK